MVGEGRQQSYTLNPTPLLFMGGIAVCISAPFEANNETDTNTAHDFIMVRSTHPVCMALENIFASRLLNGPYADSSIHAATDELTLSTCDGPTSTLN